MRFLAAIMVLTMISSMLPTIVQANNIIFEELTITYNGVPIENHRVVRDDWGAPILPSSIVAGRDDAHDWLMRHLPNVNLVGFPNFSARPTLQFVIDSIPGHSMTMDGNIIRIVSQAVVIPPATPGPEPIPPHMLQNVQLFFNGRRIDNHGIVLNSWGDPVIPNSRTHGVSDAQDWASRHLPSADVMLLQNMGSLPTLTWVIDRLPGFSMQRYALNNQNREVRNQATGHIIRLTGPEVVNVRVFFNDRELANHGVTMNQFGSAVLPDSTNWNRNDAQDWATRFLPGSDPDTLLHFGPNPSLEQVIQFLPDHSVARYRINNQGRFTQDRNNGNIFRITGPEVRPLPPVILPDDGPPGDEPPGQQIVPPVTPGIPGRIQVYFYLDRINFPDQQPENINGRVMVPIGPFVTAIGGTATWDGNTSSAGILLRNPVTGITHGVSLALGNTTMNRNSNGVMQPPVNLDVAPFLRNDRVMVPTRALSEAFGLEVEWDGPNNRVLIRTK